MKGTEKKTTKNGYEINSQKQSERSKTEVARKER
jgi:hypothetical protein